VWASVQAQTMLQFTAAHALGIAPEKVKINSMLLGGGLGRKSEVDFSMDAIFLAREVPGRAVKAIWTREADVSHGKYRPVTAQAVKVALDPGGNVAGWHQRLVCESILARYFPKQFADMKGVDNPVVDGLDFNYHIPNLHTEYRREPRGVDVGFWRSVGPGYTKFAIEGTVDEVAAATGQDPVQLRLSLLKDDPRGAAVVARAAKLADWDRRRTDTAVGIAYSDAFGAHCAQVAEIALNRETGEISVRNVWCAIDPGVAIQPDNIVAQMEGGILHGIGQALYEQINIVAGQVQETNFDSYRILKGSEAPHISVEIITSPGNAPAGIGEVGLPPIGPAIANAFARLTGGRRLRHYPFLPERVMQTLNA
jgi:isoquinoline 1-oxidoreductase subunit beta